jgi:hypothetical protein
MRGTIEVTGRGEPVGSEAETPLYLSLGLNIDAPHPAAVVPEGRPSSAAGRLLRSALPSRYTLPGSYRENSPAELWQAIRAEAATAALDDGQIWDLVAYVWQRNTTPAALEEGQALYSANCAACHGNGGAGDGPMAIVAGGPQQPGQEGGHGPQPPASFADPAQMLGASPALLQGKIIRGGMGTGMPYWGPIFTDEQSWALVSYLWTFQFDLEEQQ